jgi:kumamolisin
VSDESLVQLSGSERAPLANVTPAGQLNPSERAELTLVLRRRAALPADVIAGPTVLTSDELADRYGAEPADVDLVRQTLTHLGLEITVTDPGSRRVKVAGGVGDLAATFGTTLQQVSSPDPGGRIVTHRYRVGPLFVPGELDGIVLAVLGLDTRPQARAHFRARAAAAAGTSYAPNQVAGIYQFPAGTTGSGQRIAIIELGGGFSASDLSAYFGGLGIAVPSVTAVSVDGAANAPGSDPTGADLEVNLDIDVIGAVAPGAAQLVYFAPNNGDQGFVDAISDAAQASPAPIAISISWGQSEDSWTAQGLSAMNEAISDAAALGITVCVAAGDNGSGDGVTDGKEHVDFPASSPYALACGGTKLVADVSTGVVSSEVVWNETTANEGASGGGVSDQFALPSWQATAGVPARAAGTGGTTGTGTGSGGSGAGSGHGGGDGHGGGGDDGHGGGGQHKHHEHHKLHGKHEEARVTDQEVTSSASGGSGGSGSSGSSGGRGVPDVAGNADPTTGYQVYADGSAQVVGGTSAVAPLWAALISRLAQATGKRFGLIQPSLYAGVKPGVDVAGFRDITSGNNGAYAARPGWDACSGLGSPNGTTLLKRLQS